jgi:protein-tyrosine-phosphatase
MRFFNRGGNDDPVLRVMFLCVENAGRSQMAAALAERERERRDLGGEIEINSAGTRPADAVHDVVVEAMAEIDIDVSTRVPRVVDLETLEEMDYVVMMGCYIAEFNPSTYGGVTREWDLTNPDGADIETVRGVRDELEERVSGLFDELEREVPARD